MLLLGDVHTLRPYRGPHLRGYSFAPGSSLLPSYTIAVRCRTLHALLSYSPSYIVLIDTGEGDDNFTTLIDSGAFEYFLDGDLNPGLEDLMVDSTPLSLSLKPPPRLNIAYSTALIRASSASTPDRYGEEA